MLVTVIIQHVEKHIIAKVLESYSSLAWLEQFISTHMISTLTIQKMVFAVLGVVVYLDKNTG